MQADEARSMIVVARRVLATEEEQPRQQGTRPRCRHDVRIPPGSFFYEKAVPALLLLLGLICAGLVVGIVIGLATGALPGR
jgi:hypothetical protein